jgi:hypothetical protein
MILKPTSVTDMRIISRIFVLSLLVFAGCSKPTVLTGDDRFTTEQTYRPPVDITIVAKTDSTDLRMSYAADQIIFDWADDKTQLRVDGGPADGQHQAGAGYIPPGRYVTIRWKVTPTEQAVYVDGQLRFVHNGDYSQINNYVSVFPAVGSVVTVKSVSVKRLHDAS